jgi:catechol 2,3-dioxygenase-like lactoylglutathione lyase family enzyme
MPATSVEFRRFHHVVIAVADLGAAVADWVARLGWSPSASSAERATFPLDDSSIELVAVGDGVPGVTAVSVVIDDVAEVADRLRAKGVAFTTPAEGRIALDPAAVNGVPLELRPEDAGRGVADRAARGAGVPFRRINHIVVAVADDDAARASWADLFGDWTEARTDTTEAAHHVPVGIAWFGLTGSGTDAGALARFLDRRGDGVYALALVVDDHLATVASLEQRGAQIIHQERTGQTFVHPRTSHGTLIDLVPEAHPSRLA